MNRVAWALLLVAVTAVWGWACVLTKNAVEEYGVFAFLAVRFVLAVVVLAAFSTRHATRASWKIGGLIGIVLASAYLCMTWGLKYTSVSNSGLIIGLFVLFVPLVNRVVFGVRTQGVVWIGVGVSTVGLTLLMMGSQTSPNVGDFLSLLSSILFSLHIALLDRHARNYPAPALALAQLSCATVLFVAAWPVFDPVRLPTGDVWLALIVTGIFATAVAFYVQTAVQQRLPAVQTAVIIAMEPVFAIVFGCLLAGDRFNLVQGGGAVLMVSAVLVVELGPALTRVTRGP
ncbi:MAG: DMT family transporter [Pirellulales bacterium]|nr:DMT family transporter [Pirellulales bacterium]